MLLESSQVDKVLQPSPLFQVEHESEVAQSCSVDSKSCEARAFGQSEVSTMVISKEVGQRSQWCAQWRWQGSYLFSSLGHCSHVCGQTSLHNAGDNR